MWTSFSTIPQSPWRRHQLLALFTWSTKCPKPKDTDIEHQFLTVGKLEPLKWTSTTFTIKFSPNWLSSSTSITVLGHASLYPWVAGDAVWITLGLSGYWWDNHELYYQLYVSGGGNETNNWQDKAAVWPGRLWNSMGNGGGKCSDRSTRQGQQPASAMVQRATTSACRSPAVVGSVYSKQHFLLVAGRQKCQPPVTAALRNSLRFFA